MMAIPGFGKKNVTFIQETEKRNPVAFPPINSYRSMLNASFYRSLSDALTDRMVLRSGLLVLKRTLDYYLFYRRSFSTVDIGLDGWFFIRDGYLLPRETRDEIQKVFRQIDEFLRNLQDDRAEVLLVVAPDKHAVYPEKLSVLCKKNIAKGQDRNKILRQYFEKHQSSQVLPLWEKYNQAKKRNDENIFFKKDTHHNPRGALVMSKNIIEKLQPGLWDEKEIVDQGTKSHCGDLMLMSGLGKKYEVVREMDIQRRGVELVLKKGMDLPGTDKKMIRYTSKSSHRPMLEGKTLVLHDSMMAGSKNTVRQFFTDISFVHYETVYRAGEFDKCLDTYNRVIIEVAERVVVDVMENILDEYQYEQIYEYTEEDVSRVSYNKELKATLQKDGLEVIVYGHDPIIYFPAPQQFNQTDYILKIVMRSTVNTSSQLFYLDNGQRQFSEEKSISEEVVGGENYLKYYLPAESYYYPKRFDPSMMPGEFVIRAISILRKLNENEYSKQVDGKGEVSLRLFEVNNKDRAIIREWQQVLMGSAKTSVALVPTGLLVRAQEEDPYLILPSVLHCSEKSKPVLEIGLDVSVANVSQLFYLRSKDGRYGEDMSIRKTVRAGNNNLRFQLDPEVLEYPLRFDPGTGGGHYLVRYARITGLETGGGHQRKA